MSLQRILNLICVILIGVSTHLNATPIYSYKNIYHPVIGHKGMVASQEKLATQVGIDILKQGGNAIDAAAAVGFALAVTLPRAGNLGGGGFMLVHLEEKNETFALDYREKAPQKAQKDLFLDANGNPDPALSRDSVLSSGVPGTVAGLLDIHEKHGNLSLQDVIAPAIKLAKEGFNVTFDLNESLKRAAEKMAKYPATKAIFLDRNNNPPKVGEKLVQKDLAKTLQLISDKGKKAFYEGEIADKIEAYMKSQNGLITKSDLKAYKPIVRTPVRGTYRNHQIVSMPPPSSGGIHLIQMLNTLEHVNLAEYGHNSAKTIHMLAEVMKRAYADRSEWLGDPDFVTIPQEELISKGYARYIFNQISDFKRTTSTEISPALEPTLRHESNETTHFSIVDQWGNAISNTYTLNFSYGNKQVVPGTGILLNNEMDDFSAKPGIPNAYGLIGNDKNAIEPGKRMLSSMTPTLVFNPDGKLMLVTGTPGGSRIITSVLQVILNIIDFEMNIAESTNAIRVHHQWYPEELRVEKGLNQDTITLLEEMGYNIQTKWAMGSMQSIHIKASHLEGASDPRKPGALTLGY